MLDVFEAAEVVVVAVVVVESTWTSLCCLLLLIRGAMGLTCGLEGMITVIEFMAVDDSDVHKVIEDRESERVCLKVFQVDLFVPR